MVYQEFKNEPYGGSGVFGHKIWVRLSGAPEKKTLRVLTDKLKKKYQPKGVLLNRQLFDANELTLFVYYGRQPETAADNWIADTAITVSL